MFINCSNHQSHQWGEDQLKEAHEYGPIIDVQFPNVPPQADIAEIDRLAKDIANQIELITLAELENFTEVVAMVQGEYTTVYRILCNLDERIIAVAATSTRDGNGQFKFVGFRPYEA